MADQETIRARIEANPVAGSPEEMRTAFSTLVGAQPNAAQASLGAVDALAVGSGPTLLWFHGGGYVFGSPETHVALASALAASGLTVLLPRYSLAPEAPWPAMLDDALAAIDATTGPIAVGGDSAGGHLALNAALRRPGRIRAVALLSPNTDRSGLSRTRAALSERDLMNDDAQDAALARLAFGNRPGDDRDLSPILTDLSALPPLFVEVGADEVLLDDSLLLARAATLAGVPATLHVSPGTFHLAALWPQAIDAGARQLARLGDAVARALR